MDCFVILSSRDEASDQRPLGAVSSLLLSLSADVRSSDDVIAFKGREVGEQAAEFTTPGTAAPAATQDDAAAPLAVAATPSNAPATAAVD